MRMESDMKKLIVVLAMLLTSACISEQEQLEAQNQLTNLIHNECSSITGFPVNTTQYSQCSAYFQSIRPEFGVDYYFGLYDISQFQSDLNNINYRCSVEYGSVVGAMWPCIKMSL